MFTLREATGVSGLLVLLVTEHTRMAGLAAAGVRVRVDCKAAAMDTPGEGETGKAKIDQSPILQQSSAIIFRFI